MKDLITAVASLLLLMIFVMQFAVNQGTQHRILQADMAVAVFRDTVKEQGYISRENSAALRGMLAEICGCGEEEIMIERNASREVPQKRGTLLYYQIRYPVKSLIAMAASLGIRDEDNRIYMEQKGWVVSCYEEPDTDNGDCNPDGNESAVRDGLSSSDPAGQTG